MNSIIKITLGAGIVALGIIMLLYSYDILPFPFPWSLIKKGWPIFIIIGGLYILIRNEEWRERLKVITIVLLIIWLFSIIGSCLNIGKKVSYHVSSIVEKETFEEPQEKQKEALPFYSEPSREEHSFFVSQIPVKSNVLWGKCKIEGGMMSFLLKDTSLADVLVSYENFPKDGISIYSNTNKDTIIVKIEVKGTKANLTTKNNRKIIAGLPSNINWEIEFNGGISEGNILFTHSVPYRISLEGGISTSTITILPELKKDVLIDIKGGVSEWKLVTNKSNCVFLNATTVLSAVEIREDGVKKREMGGLMTFDKNFLSPFCRDNGRSSRQYKVKVNIEGAVSSVIIDLLSVKT